MKLCCDGDSLLKVLRSFFTKQLMLRNIWTGFLWRRATGINYLPIDCTEICRFVNVAEFVLQAIQMMVERSQVRMLAGGQQNITSNGSRIVDVLSECVASIKRFCNVCVRKALSSAR